LRVKRVLRACKKSVACAYSNPAEDLAAGLCCRCNGQKDLVRIRSNRKRNIRSKPEKIRESSLSRLDPDSVHILNYIISYCNTDSACRFARRRVIQQMTLPASPGWILYTYYIILYYIILIYIILYHIILYWRRGWKGSLLQPPLPRTPARLCSGVRSACALAYSESRLPRLRAI
jgi:hypothetical protein